LCILTDENSNRGARWGVLGGTFDPPHLGHFSLAQAALGELHLQRVLWVPVFHPPHKQGREITPYALRATMAEMTARRERAFDVSRIEAELGGESYTVKTLAHLGGALPEIELYFIVGADVMPELKDWFRPERISRWATLACGVRPGYERPALDTLPVGKVVYFDSPEMDISSSDIRRLVGAGESVGHMLSPEVLALIKSEGLYRNAE
jgi:nicotinate-nucleotide adenylyltransferase